MKKFTFSSLIVLVAFLFSAANLNAQSYPQAGLTVLPYGSAQPDQEIALVLDVLATCPDSALLNADSVMMHSGVTIGEDHWQHVVEYNQMGANGQSTKLYPFSPGAMLVSMATQDPFTPVTADDMCVVVVFPKWTAPAGGLDGADTVYMHAGVEINGQPWQNVVEYTDPNAAMTPYEIYGEQAWIKIITPRTYFNIPDSITDITAINCVFNAGDWDHKGGDWTHDGGVEDFRLQFAGGHAYKYSMIYTPNDFYALDEGQTIKGIDCVFNAGSWDAGEGKAHNEAGDACEDFYAPLGSTGIVNNAAQNSFEIYPNPVNDVLSISNLNGANEIVIYDVTGKTVLSQPVNSDKVTINVSDLHKGMYVVNIYGKGAVQAKKFLKR